ncbi:hypothetical protein FB192DRAFT_1300018 [Mucor lusitanicus]|uniref:Uncharacterized protein n=1 Tax=Mucor circinelloides f. lusitanicus TaxID=29924 RepID=A0A8H4BKE2_MUCCL|nr:hypothetical protein FB192DRAFT_1300018 [Mucor lusitanicus]
MFYIYIYNTSKDSLNSNSLPPIVVEVQYTGNMTFYRRLIDYGLSVTKRHSSPPVVPVIIIHNTTAELTSLTVASKKQSFLLELPWHDWAKSCYLINAASISSHLQSSPLNPLVALGHFLIQQKPSIRYIDRNDDKTIQEIFGEGLQQHESTITAKDLQDIHDQCTKAKSFLLEDVPNESSPRKIWHRYVLILTL